MILVIKKFSCLKVCYFAIFVITILEPWIYSHHIIQCWKNLKTSDINSILMWITIVFY